MTKVGRQATLSATVKDYLRLRLLPGIVKKIYNCGKKWTLGFGQANWNCLPVGSQKSSPLLDEVQTPPHPIPLPTSQWRKTKPLLRSCYLYGSPKLLIAEAAHECPPTAGDVRHLCDGLHLLRAANAYLESQNSKMDPHGSES